MRVSVWAFSYDDAFERALRKAEPEELGELTAMCRDGGPLVWTSTVGALRRFGKLEESKPRRSKRGTTLSADMIRRIWARKK